VGDGSAIGGQPKLLLPAARAQLVRTYPRVVRPRCCGPVLDPRKHVRMEIEHPSHASRQSDALSPLRVLFLNEDVLGHRVLARRLRRLLREHEEVSTRFATVPAPGRVGAVLLRRVPALGSLDLRPLRWRLRWSWSARRIVRHAGTGFDVLFVNTQSCALLLGGLMQNIPTVVSVDATGRQFARLGYWGPPGRLARVADRPGEALERRTLERATLVMAWTEWAAESLRRDYGLAAERIVVLHPGIDLTPFASIERGPPLRGPLRLLFIGNDVERKGLPTLIAALAEVGRPVVLDVVTEDAVAETEGVRVHAGITADSQEALRMFGDADVLVLPTHADCAPFVVLEGMAAGLPVVSTPVGAIPELLGDTGICTPVGDIPALAAALRRLADDPGLRLDLGARGRSRVGERFDAAMQSRCLVEVLQRAAWQAL
jgi:glycosyltransferase involved in cell wall biosynthesis